MQLMIKQRVFSLSDTYDVYDENKEIRYYVKGEFLSFGHQIHVFDKRTGEEVGSIHQKMFNFIPQFEIVIGGRTVGSIRRECILLHPRYIVDLYGLDILGDMIEWDYSICRDGNEVMTISKQLFHWGDTYILDYSDCKDELPGLLLVIAIDAINSNTKD